MNNDLKAHQRYVLLNPRVRAAALALVDHVQETSCCNRMAALRTVARLTLARRRARRLAVAAKWLAHRQDVGSYLRREIVRCASPVASPYALRILVPGFHPPRTTLRVVAGPVRTRRTGTIMVSAGWLILRVAEWFNPACNRLAILQAQRGP